VTLCLKHKSHLHVIAPFYTGLWTPCLSGTSDHWSVPGATCCCFRIRRMEYILGSVQLDWHQHCLLNTHTTQKQP